MREGHDRRRLVVAAVKRASHLEFFRDEYLEGRLTLAQFEAYVESLLRAGVENEYDNLSVIMEIESGFYPRRFARRRSPFAETES